jgi:iron complex transport system substrate-binding protein
MTITDDLGRRLTLPDGARRIVSLSPATTENLFAIGAGRWVVGITSACNYPVGVEKIPSVGDFTRPSFEKILALKPEVIVFDSATVKKLEVESFAARVRVPVFVQRSERVADVPRHLRELARIVSLPAISFRLPPQKKIKPVSVFVEISASPLYAVGPGSYVDDLIRLAGGQNVVTTGDPFPQLTKEKLLTLKPQLYVIATNPGQPETPPALRNIPVARIPADLLFRPTPRLSMGLRLLTAALRAVKSSVD